MMVKLCSCLLVLAVHSWSCLAQTYDDYYRLVNDKLGSNSNYSTIIRPISDQSQHITVDVQFNAISILELNSVVQQFVLNGFLNLTWTDEKLAWNPADYGGIQRIRPTPVQIWRPRLILANTAAERDMFEDKYAPLSVDYNGQANWRPGSLFPSTCSLDMTNYPFDTQTCSLQFYTMGPENSEIQFSSQADKVDFYYYTENGEYEIPDTEIVAHNSVLGPTYFEVKFHLKRLPGFFVINIVMPVVLLSFLNIMVFIIPVDSGEKISYAITVLLSLTVFTSAVNDSLPSSSNIIPVITIYLLIVTTIAVSTVLVTVVSVRLHHWKEAYQQKQEKRQDMKAINSFKGITRRIRQLQKFMNPSKVIPEEEGKTQEDTDDPNKVISLQPQCNGDLESFGGNCDTEMNPPCSDRMNNLNNYWKINTGMTTPVCCDKQEEDESASELCHWKHVALFVSHWIDFVSFWFFMLVWLVSTATILGKISM